MKLPTYYPDGYTRRGFIKARENDYGPLHFEYRPALPEERDEVMHVVRTKASGHANAVVRQLIAKQLVSWDVTNPKTGGAVEPTAESVRRLPPHMYDRLYFIIVGVQASDPDGEAEAGEDESEFVAALLESEAKSRPIGDVQAENDAKNSQAA